MPEIVDSSGRKIAAIPAAATPAAPATAVRAGAASPVWVIVLAAAMVGGFGLLYAEASRNEARLEARLEERTERVEAKVEALGTRLEALGTRLEALGTRLETMARRVEQVATRLEGLPGQVNAGIRDANRPVTESVNALSQKVEKSLQRSTAAPSSSPPPSASAYPRSNYSTYPDPVRPRQSFR